MSDAGWPFGALAMFGYDVIVADPPWDFALWEGFGNELAKFELEA